MQPGTKTHVQSQEGVYIKPASRSAGSVLLFKVHAIEIGANLGDCSLWLAAASMQRQIMTKTIPLWSLGRALTRYSSLRQSACRPFQVLAASRLALKFSNQVAIPYSSIFNEVGKSDEPIAAKASVIHQKKKNLTSETHVVYVCLCQSHVMICHDTSTFMEGGFGHSQRNPGRPTKQSFLTGTCIGGSSSCRSSFSKVR